MKDRLTEIVKEINRISLDEKEKIINLLQTLLNESIDFHAKNLKLKQCHNTKNVEIGTLTEEYGVNVGIERSKNTIIFADWIFKLQTTTKINLLYFLLVKESLLHFIQYQLDELDQALLNIIGFLWLKKHFQIRTRDNPLLATVTSMIYTETIAGVAYQHFNTILNFLFIKNISYDEALTEYMNIKKKNIQNTEKLKVFNQWVFSRLKTEDIIAPIHLRTKLNEILAKLVELGFENGSAINIAKELKTHENTARYYFQEIATTYSAFWRPIINIEKIKLHNYFLRVILKDSTVYDQVYKLIWDIPYTKSIYDGRSVDQKILYSPSLICPHLSSEILNGQLLKLEKKGLIEYNLQLVRQKRHYATTTSRIPNPTLKTFKELLFGKNPNEKIQKFIFSNEIRDSSMEFDDRDVSIDYNLLYFLSVLRNKYLLKSRLGVNVAQLQKLFETNNILISDDKAKNDFLSRIEYRARRRKILTYDLYMRSYSPRSSDVLVFEIPSVAKHEEKLLSDTIEKLRVFCFLGQITIANRDVFIIPGISHEHPVKDMIKQKIDENGLISHFYTINLNKGKFVPLQDLFNYEEQKWKTA